MFWSEVDDAANGDELDDDDDDDDEEQTYFGQQLLRAELYVTNKPQVLFSQYFQIQLRCRFGISQVCARRSHGFAAAFGIVTRPRWPRSIRLPSDYGYW